MDELTPQQLGEQHRTLIGLREELQRLIASTRDSTRPVDLDEPIGRLTRMDAIQQQKMSTANRRSYEIRLRQVESALAAVERGTYGLCRRCEEPIGYPRLAARPESPFCLECQDALDRRHD